jgi:photosystem II biogenesis protein Psp29
MGIRLSLELPVNTVRTVSDTKRAFYNTHTRPINSIYRRVVEELMVEMHLLSVNADFRYDDIYALGITTAFDRFMQGYRPEQDRDSVFNALCQAIGEDPGKYRQSAERVRGEIGSLSVSDFLARLQTLQNTDGSAISSTLKQVAENPRFKYSRLFAIGIYTLLELMDAEWVKDTDKLNEALKQICDALNLSSEKLQKDLELYRSNLDKMVQAQIVMEDILKAERKKREDREKARQAATTPPNGSQESA